MTIPEVDEDEGKPVITVIVKTPKASRSLTRMLSVLPVSFSLFDLWSIRRTLFRRIL